MYMVLSESLILLAPAPLLVFARNGGVGRPWNDFGHFILVGQDDFIMNTIKAMLGMRKEPSGQRQVTSNAHRKTQPPHQCRKQILKVISPERSRLNMMTSFLASFLALLEALFGALLQRMAENGAQEQKADSSPA